MLPTLTSGEGEGVPPFDIVVCRSRATDSVTGSKEGVRFDAGGYYITHSDLYGHPFSIQKFCINSCSN
jgi:hypothetical protein